MPKFAPTATPELNRLRAAAALIPIIEGGLFQKSLSVERASLMASFCAWAYSQKANTPESEELIKAVGDGLKRLEVALAADS